jgi:hypothetical protein
MWQGCDSCGVSVAGRGPGAVAGGRGAACGGGRGLTLKEPHPCHIVPVAAVRIRPELGGERAGWPGVRGISPDDFRGAAPSYQ